MRDSMPTKMKVEEFSKLVDYVADLRSKLQRGRTRLRSMQEWLTLLQGAGGEMIEVALWRDAIDDQEQFLDNLTTQLCEYESLVGWR